MQLCGGEGLASAKALRQGHAWCVGGAVRRPVCLERRSERGGGPGHGGPCSMAKSDIRAIEGFGAEE